ncbi:hypothetical protein ACQR1I_32785 [Bradyrhizobium sp. HKCCYLS2038]|uniref:hypothetical protein n=1 Tax=unclassified Bradyrhizobium TaxID=2631580 RepID=UPI003EBC2A06
MAFSSLLRTGAGPLSEAALRDVAARASTLDVSVSLSNDFDELYAVNRANRDSWDALMPQFHPDYFSGGGDAAFWIKGTDQTGEVILTRGYRRYDLSGGQTMHDALVGMSLFYDDPARAQPGEQVVSTAETPRRVRGSFALSGAQWIHPRFRRAGLSSLTWPAGRSMVCDLWQSPFLFAFVEDVPKMKSVLGFQSQEGGIRWTNSYVGPSFDFTIIWWTLDEMRRDVEDFLRHGQSG